MASPFYDDPEDDGDDAESIGRAFAASSEAEAPTDEPDVEGADSSPAPPSTASDQEQNNSDGSEFQTPFIESTYPAEQGPYQPDDGVPDEEQSYGTPNELDDLAAHTQQPTDAADGTSVGTGGIPKGPVAPMAPALQDNSANYQELEREMSSFKPGDYKPSGLRRALAGIAGGLVAAGSHNAGEGMAVARAVTGAPLNRAQAQEQQRENATRQKIAETGAANAAAQQNFGNQNTQFRNQEAQVNDAALQEQRNEHAQDFAAQAAARRNAITQFTPDDPNNPYAGGTGVTADGRTQKGVAPPDAWLARWEKSPQGQAAISNMTTDQRKKAATVAGLKGEQWSQFVATGKISPTPRTSIHVPSAELQKYEDWRNQFTKDNGRAPNAAEIAGFGHANSGALSRPLADKIESQKNTAFSQAKQAFEGAQDKGAAAESYRSDLQDAQDAYEQRIENATGQPVPHVTISVDKNGNVNWGGAQPAQSSPQQPPAQAQQGSSATMAVSNPQQQPQKFTYKGQSYTSGQQVMVDGKPAVVKGINPATGKLIVGAQ